MGMKEVYSCNICRDEIKPNLLYGICFSTMKKFTIKDAKSTQGVHICTSCLRQLKEQTSNMEIPDEQARI